jgi:hypothetical protein
MASSSSDTQSKGSQVVVIGLLFTVIAATTVAFRLFTRLVILRSPGREDILIFLALVRTLISEPVSRTGRNSFAQKERHCAVCYRLTSSLLQATSITLTALTTKRKTYPLQTFSGHELNILQRCIMAWEDTTALFPQKKEPRILK